MRSGALVASVLLFLLAVLAALALASYHPGDPAINTAGGGPARNLVGLPGAWFADLALTIVRNRYLNGEVIRIDGALRMAPR